MQYTEGTVFSSYDKYNLKKKNSIFGRFRTLKSMNRLQQKKFPFKRCKLNRHTFDTTSRNISKQLLFLNFL